MVLTRILENKTVIRLFGLGFALSPIGNTVLSMSIQKIQNKWTLDTASRVLAAMSTTNLILMACSFALGLIMLSGSTKVWKLTLAVLGAFIAFKITRLGADMRAHWLHGLFFVINVGAFLFIADQLVFKQKTNSTKSVEKPLSEKSTATVAAVPTPLSQPATYNRRLLLAIGEETPWAKLVGISIDGLQVRAMKQPHVDLHGKTIVLAFEADFRLRLRLHAEQENLYSFRFVDLTLQDIRRLNQWSLSLKLAAPTAA